LLWRIHLFAIKVRRDTTDMALVRIASSIFGPIGGERPGLIDSQGKLRDLSAVVPDITAATLGPGLLERLARTDHARLPSVTAAPPSVVYCIVGLLNRVLRP
jgi:hypothetical protein